MENNNINQKLADAYRQMYAPTTDDEDLVNEGNSTQPSAQMKELMNATAPHNLNSKLVMVAKALGKMKTKDGINDDVIRAVPRALLQITSTLNTINTLYKLAEKANHKYFKESMK